MNKSAREMFEELGYKNVIKNDKKVVFENYDIDTSIEFSNDDEHKAIILQELGINDSGDYYVITLDEHKAINQQIKELGWLDD